MKTTDTKNQTMTTTPQPPRRHFSSIPPFREIHTAAELELERRLQALRERVGDDARIEIARVDHQPACASHDHRRCDCADPVPVVIVGGRDWIRLLADGTAEDATPPQPRPDWLDSDEGHHRLAECLPVHDWLRTAVCCHASTIVGEGPGARFLHGVIDRELTRRLARLEGPQPLSLP